MFARIGMVVGLFSVLAIGCGGSSGGNSTGAAGSTGSAGTGDNSGTAGDTGAAGDGDTGNAGTTGTAGTGASATGAKVGEACPHGNGDCASGNCFDDGENPPYCTTECSFGTNTCKQYGSSWDCAEITAGGSTSYLCVK